MPLRAELRLGLLAMLVAVTACLSPVDPTGTPVALVRVTFDGANTSDTIQVRGTTRATAAALAAGGYDLGRRDFQFTSSDTSVAVVDANGVVRAVRPGIVTIRAIVAGRSGEGTVVVVASTVAYTIPVGRTPGALAFSTDYARLYVAIAPDSLAIVDALGYFRLAALGLGFPALRIAATATEVYATHADIDSVSVVSTATNSLTGRIFVGAGPTGIVADTRRAYVAARYDRKIVILEGDRVGLAIPVNGEPRLLAVARDGRRLFATVKNAGSWRLAVAAPAVPDTIESLPLSSEPTAIATDMSGERVYVLLASESRVLVLVEGSDGRYREAGSVTVGAGARGISARLVGTPVVVVSGEPLTLFDGVTLRVLEVIGGVGGTEVAVRPDGVFAFVSDPALGVVRVIGL